MSEAMELPATSVMKFRADVSVLYPNVADAVAALAKERDTLTAVHGVSEQQWKLVESAPRLALALDFAVRQAIIAQGKTPTEIRSQLRRASELRRLLLRSAQAAEAAGLLARHDLEVIEHGSGSIDIVNDVIDLVALFTREQMVLRGKTPVEAVHLTEAAQLGASLKATLRPEPAHDAPDPARPAYEAAADRRDRIWTLLNQRADLIWDLGTRLWKRKVGEHLRLLQSRVVTPRTAEAQPPAQPGGGTVA
ncbi:MAG: hypothetical protein U1F43_08695 [Myxococcota bacterium]